MKVYLFLDILIIIFPLLYSFEKKIRYYQNFRALAVSILATGSFFLAWDILATQRGDWIFNHVYLVGIRFWGIPLEEILFFVVVPYSCLFIYETVCFYLEDKEINPHVNFYFIVVVLAFLAYVNRFRTYTFTVLSISAIILSVTLYFSPKIFRSKNFWLFMLISFVPFVGVNYILTSLPIVSYSPFAIMGQRFLTIPYEDFLYSFAMLTMYFGTYMWGKDRFKKPNPTAL